MIDALNAAAESLSNDLTRMAGISQNLVNGATPGYKREMLHTQTFANIMLRAAAGAGGSLKLAGGMPQVDLITDHKQGTIKHTGNPMDFALEDTGYFEVMTDFGLAYTRQGNFRVDPRGRLVSDAEHPVQGVSGEIELTNANPTVDKNGSVFDGERLLGQIKVVKFVNPQKMKAMGAGVFQQADAVPAAGEFTGKVRQGYLEMSNVNSMSEMVRLIETARHAESTQKIVQGIDEMLERSMRKLGEF
jgi:flagellar basal-body rod protein FlgF